MVDICFPECGCSCGPEGQEFDTLLQEETTFSVTLRDLSHSNIGWFYDFDDLRFCDWELSQDSGVYILWHKNDYCSQHEQFHCRALYVGNGRVKARIFSHAQKNDFGDDMVVYFSYLEMPNRCSKYVEQLLLDIYDFPMNKAENTGSNSLCSYIGQAEADFGTFA